MNERKNSWKVPLIVFSMLILVGFSFGWGLAQASGQIELSIGLGTIAGFFMVLFLTIIVAVVVHELGHLVVGLLNHYHFYAVQFFFLYIYKENGKLKITVKKANAGVAGLCLMFPGENLTIKNHLYYILGGVFFNGLSCLYFLAVFLLTSSGWVRIYSGVALTLTLLLIILNLFPNEKSTVYTDGMIAKLLRDGSPDGEGYLLYQTLSAMLISGVKRPRDMETIEIKKSYNEFVTVMLSTLQYSIDLDKKNTESLRKRIYQLRPEQVALGNIQRVILYGICVFHYSFIEIDLELAEKYFAEGKKDLMTDKDLNGRRILAYYTYYIEKNAVEAVNYIEEGLSRKESYPVKGLMAMEEELLLELKKVILAEKSNEIKRK